MSAKRGIPVLATSIIILILVVSITAIGLHFYGGTVLQINGATSQSVYTVYMYVHPSYGGSILLNSVYYSDGQTVQLQSGQYSISNNAGYGFTNWGTTGGVSVVCSSCSSTSIKVNGSGNLILTAQGPSATTATTPVTTTTPAATSSTIQSSSTVISTSSTMTSTTSIYSSSTQTSQPLVTITFPYTLGTGTPQFSLTMILTVSASAPQQMIAWRYFNNGPFSGLKEYVGQVGNGPTGIQQRFALLTEGPATSYTIVVTDATGCNLTFPYACSGAVVAQARIDNVPFYSVNVSSPSTVETVNRVLEFPALDPNIKQFTIQIPQQNAVIIRAGILRWFDKSVTYAQLYSGMNFYQIWPPVFTVTGVNSTGNEIVKVLYQDNYCYRYNNNSAEACANSYTGSNGYTNSGVIVLSTSYITNPTTPNPYWTLGDVTYYEFGHILGIGDLWRDTNVDYTMDGMYYPTNCITTLDIYAPLLNHQAALQGTNYVGNPPLPSNIPYQCLP